MKFSDLKNLAIGALLTATPLASMAQGPGQSTIGKSYQAQAKEMLVDTNRLSAREPAGTLLNDATLAQIGAQNINFVHLPKAKPGQAVSVAVDDIMSSKEYTAVPINTDKQDLSKELNDKMRRYLVVKTARLGQMNQQTKQLGGKMHITPSRASDVSANGKDFVVTTGALGKNDVGAINAMTQSVHLQQRQGLSKEQAAAQVIVNEALTMNLPVQETGGARAAVNAFRINSDNFTLQRAGGKSAKPYEMMRMESFRENQKILVEAMKGIDAARQTQKVTPLALK